MDQARSTISKIFNGEPRSYTRFNLTQNMEGDNSQVEMKLSSDMDEEVGGNGVGEHMNHHPRPTYVGKPSQRSSRNFCFMGIAILLLFIIGYLVGYLAHRRTDRDSPRCAEAFSSDESDGVVPIQTVPSLDWSDITALFKTKLTTSSIENSLSEFSIIDHQAGSPGDEALANKLLKRFKDYSMNPWTDEHFVRVQDGPSSGTNRITFRDQPFVESGFLSYSATGSVQGALLYAYYGQTDDLRRLQDLDIDMSGRVLLIRAGKISFAEKVANAAAMNASAVLIYPDPADYSFNEETALFGHVHLGCGDPYTPGFPSFNHTQFPPAQSSGLPTIPAQTIRASTAAAIMRQMEGRDPPRGWGDGGLRSVKYRLGSDSDLVTVEVNNVLTEKKIHNVFGVIKGFIDADRYVVIGAQRDAWGPGYAKSTVGTSLLVELARIVSEMISKNGFKPRRSIVFASWSAGEYGAVGATEWLEGYLSSLNMKAFSYISLDGVVTGSSFKASASPLLYDLIQSTLKEVSSPTDSSTSLYSQVSGNNWEATVMEPMTLSDPAYPFQAFSGIPSVSIRFTSDKEYPFFGTMLDTKQNLNFKISFALSSLVKSAGEIAGQMALRLVHDHLLKLNVEKYTTVLRSNVALINKEVFSLQSSGRVPKTLKMQWLMSALGSYSRASRKLISVIQNSDLEDFEQCRIINNRIMGVERDLLSPYVSPRVSPFRHILHGSGSHTLGALLAHLAAIKEDSASADLDLLRNQFALTTWTIQNCANALAGSVWEMDNEV
ncbi:transferrin receptor 1a [Salminus brasiliensis]|uniref:transferrin receptor 1a n=1 Tax=Salminus brasiliensis TaxID=930266 RepID=UPI003B839155